MASPTGHSISFSARTFLRASVALLALAIPSALFAQSETNSSLPAVEFSSSAAQNPSLPSAPAPQQPSTPQSADQPNEQTSRILGILPNFRAVSTDVHLPPQSVKQKFTTAAQDSFDYSSIFVPLVVAGISYERNSTPEFGSGGIGYARYLWHTALDQTQENFFVEFIVPSVTHEDIRFYTLGRGSFGKRAGYALSRVVVTRSDDGKSTFNFGEVLGSGMSAGLSNAYYPSAERSFSNTGQQWALNIAVDAAAFVVKEFWPDVNHYLFHAAKPSTTPTN